MAVDHVRYQWDEGRRRLEAAGEGTARSRHLLLLVDAVVDELRRRVGQTYTLNELAGAYRGSEEWCARLSSERRLRRRGQGFATRRSSRMRRSPCTPTERPTTGRDGRTRRGHPLLARAEAGASPGALSRAAPPGARLGGAGPGDDRRLLCGPCGRPRARERPAAGRSPDRHPQPEPEHVAPVDPNGDGYVFVTLGYVRSGDVRFSRGSGWLIERRVAPVRPPTPSG